MRAIYSVGVLLGRGGVGASAWHAAAGLHAAGYLWRLIVNAYKRTPVPPEIIRTMGWLGRAIKKIAFYESSGRATDWTDAIFDAWGVRHVRTCDVFHGWGQMSLRQIRRAHRHGGLTIVEKGSAHNLLQARLMEEEARRWNIKRPLTVTRAIRRALTEIAETDFIAVQSEFAYRSYLESGVPVEKIVLIPLGVDVRRFSPPAERPTRRMFHVVFVGLVGLQKGVPDLLEAWRLAALPDAQLSLAGVIGSEMSTILERHTSLPNVHWLGHVADPVPLLQSADVFILPSIQEGFGLATYEAMATALPVIVTTNAGASPQDGMHGFVVPIRDPAALADRLTILYRDLTLRRAMGQAARNYALNFTWERYQARLVAAYSRLQSGERPNGPDWIL
jgi:glycosyltransferase involved in cell wall biosynthesis